jgi:hypothetical protein
MTAYTVQADVTTAKIKQQIEIIKQHPEQKEEAMKQVQLLKQQMPTFPPMKSMFFLVTLYFLGLLVALSGAYYYFTLSYMQKLWPAKAKQPGVGHFFYWLRKILWKYIRPILWMLLPLIGPIFWLRSVYRSFVVSPLALMQEGDELKNSWDLTKGKVWRIIGNYWGFGICLAVLVWLPLGILLGVIYVLGGKSASYQIFSSLISAISIAFGAYCGSIFSCVAYRILKDEYAATGAGTSPAASPTV